MHDGNINTIQRIDWSAYEPGFDNNKTIKRTHWKLTVGLTVLIIEVEDWALLPTVEKKIEPLSSLCIFKSLFPMLMALRFPVGKILYEY